MTEEEFRGEVLRKLSSIETILGSENQPGLLHEVKSQSHRLALMERWVAGFTAVGSFVILVIGFLIAIWKR